MRLVLDTSVLVAAIRSEAGASRQLLVGALERRSVMLASVPLMIEYQAVMTGPDHLAVAGIAGADVDVVLDALACLIEPVRLAFLWRPVSPDPADDMVIETAVNGGADAIVTFNLRDLAAPAARFGLEVTTPPDMYRKLKDR